MKTTRTRSGAVKSVYYKPDEEYIEQHMEKALKFL
jgi:hypothetical protein